MNRRFHGEPGEFFEAARRLGLGPHWRLHVVEELTLSMMDFVLYNDDSGQAYVLKLDREELANDTVGCQLRILKWMEECRDEEKRPFFPPPKLEKLDRIETLLSGGKTRKIELDD